MPAVKCQRSQIDLNKRRRISCKWLGTGWVSFKEGRNHSFRIVSITLSLGQWISMVLEKKEGFFWDSYSFRITNFKDNPYLVYFSKCLQGKPQSPQSFWARSMSVKNFSHGSRGIHPLWKELHSAPQKLPLLLCTSRTATAASPLTTELCTAPTNICSAAGGAQHCDSINTLPSPKCWWLSLFIRLIRPFDFLRDNSGSTAARW